jgi:hypothetical protein
MAGTGGAITCLRDVACEELGCDTNASCVVGSDQLRTCVCKNGYTGNGKTCTPVSCDAPAIENGTVSTSSGNTFGSTATYRCSTGNQQTAGGSWTRICGANMQWSGTQPVCGLVNCGSPPAPSAEGAVSAPQTTYNSQARYTCSAGFEPAETILTCRADGAWSGSAPRCAPTCGNARPDEREPCDVSVPGTSPWTCSATCTKTTIYNLCSASAPCGTGEICGSLGICSRSCSTPADCPATPQGVVIRACGGGACIPFQCSTGRDCAPGLKCYVPDGAAIGYCQACSNGGTTGGQCR